MHQGIGYQFNHAIVRRPGESVAGGIRDGAGPDPEPARFYAEHDDYLEALVESGLSVICLPALEEFPDSVFVEDPALCLPRGAVLLRARAASRRGEVAEIAPLLSTHFADLRRIEGPGWLDGGDILVTDREVIVGRSARSDDAGYAELAAILDEWGYAARLVDTPPDVLHLKTACSALSGDLLLCTPALADSGIFDGYRQVLTAPGEEAAANAVRINDRLLFSIGFPATQRRVRAALPGVELVALRTAQAARVDGGLSCMSLRFAL